MLRALYLFLVFHLLVAVTEALVCCHIFLTLTALVMAIAPVTRVLVAMRLPCGHRTACEGHRGVRQLVKGPLTLIWAHHRVIAGMSVPTAAKIGKGAPWRRHLP